MTDGCTWRVFERTTGFLHRRIYLIFESADHSFEASADLEINAAGAQFFKGHCDGINLELSLTPTKEGDGWTQTVAWEGELKLAGEISGEIVVRNGNGRDPYAELSLPGFTRPICLTKDDPVHTVSAVTVFNLPEATATFFPGPLGIVQARPFRKLVPKRHRYFGEVALKHEVPSLSETSRCALAALALVTSEIIEDRYLRSEADFLYSTTASRAMLVARFPAPRGRC